MHGVDTAPTFHVLAARHVVTDPAAIDALDREHLRIADDEALVFGTAPVGLDDPHAIDVADGGWHVARLTEGEALRAITAMTDWPVGDARPVTLQGLAVGIPVKLILPGDDTATLVVPSAYLAELQERWR